SPKILVSTPTETHKLSQIIFFFQAEDGIRDFHVTGVQTCALPIYSQLELAHHLERTLRRAVGSCGVGVAAGARSRRDLALPRDRCNDARYIRCSCLEVFVDEPAPRERVARAVGPVAALHGQLDGPDLECCPAPDLRSLEEHARADRDRNGDLAAPHVDRDTRSDARVDLDGEAERIEVD